MSDLLLPRGFRKRRDIDFSRFKGYVRHKPCNGEAFWFTCWGKTFLQMDWSEVWFEDGQIKMQNKRVEDYKCPHCRRTLEGKDLINVRLQGEKEAEQLHDAEHRSLAPNAVCVACGKRKKP